MGLMVSREAQPEYRFALLLPFKRAGFMDESTFPLVCQAAAATIRFASFKTLTSSARLYYVEASAADGNGFSGLRTVCASRPKDRAAVPYNPAIPEKVA